VVELVVLFVDMERALVVADDTPVFLNQDIVDNLVLTIFTPLIAQLSTMQICLKYK
jgi:hypothetical protein